jgi:hypothetical protein
MDHTVSVLVSHCHAIPPQGSHPEGAFALDDPNPCQMSPYYAIVLFSKDSYPPFQISNAFYLLVLRSSLSRFLFDVLILPQLAHAILTNQLIN